MVLMQAALAGEFLLGQHLDRCGGLEQSLYLVEGNIEGRPLHAGLVILEVHQEKVPVRFKEGQQPPGISRPDRGGQGNESCTIPDGMEAAKLLVGECEEVSGQQGEGIGL